VFAASDVPEILVSPYFVPTSIAMAGSSITVITRNQIDLSSATSVAQLLRTVPGVTVVESGGPGATSEVRLRGGETGHTLVLIDGVRVNDPATARDEFDFSLISPQNIERIEILRGPQSSIYGSDAMGGVVNIITRKAQAAPSLGASVEGGSYGTHAERLSGGFALGDLRILMSGEHIASAGFSRVGNRDTDEADGFDKWNGSINGVFAPVGAPKFEFGLTGLQEHADYDKAPPSSGSATAAANALNTVDKTLITGFGKMSFTSADGNVDQSLIGLFTASHRHNIEPGASSHTYDFASTDVGAEYQAQFNVGALGRVVVGGRLEQEQANYLAITTPPGSTSGFDSSASRFALFAGDQVSPIDNLHLSFSGRYDGTVGSDGFLTGRATAAYEIPATETKLRASLGTGAKRPTAFMVANNIGVGILTPLNVEKSIGGDVGIDQTLFDGRLTLSATAYDSRFSDLLTFDSGTNAYVNVGAARMAGVELAATAVILPSRLSLTGSYTYLDGRDLSTGKLLARRPMQSGSATLSYTGASGLEASITATLVGLRYNKANELQPMAGYGRIDFAASYPLSSHTRIFGRIDNLTDVRYQDPTGYNTPGLSAYVGLSWKD